MSSDDDAALVVELVHVQHGELVGVVNQDGRLGAVEADELYQVFVDGADDRGSGLAPTHHAVRRCRLWRSGKA